MYRALPLLLILGAASAAPQSTFIDSTEVGEDLSPGPDPDPSTIPVLPLAAEEIDDEEVVSTTVAEDLTETTESTTTEVTTTKRPKKRYRSRSNSPSYSSKLSYFQKSEPPAGVNQIDGSSGKRRFISKCRCEKIWNCPKLQITVPRCPNEYFLCCF